MTNKEFLQNGGGTSLLARFNKGFGGIDLVKILRYYGTKALRRKICNRSADQYSCGRSEPVMLNCQSVSEQRLEGFAKAKTAMPFNASEQERHDNTLGIGVPCHVILNLFQDLATVTKRMPPTLTLPPTLRYGNRVASRSGGKIL